MTIPPPPAAPAMDKASSRATTSLVLGIVGLICCQLCSPFAWYMGSQELKAVKAGASSQASQGFAMAGMVLGIIGSILMILTLCWFVFFGGMAILSGIAGASGN